MKNLRSKVLFCIVLCLVSSIIFSLTNSFSLVVAFQESNTKLISTKKQLEETVPSFNSMLDKPTGHEIVKTTISEDIVQSTKSKLRHVVGKIVPGQYIVVLKKDPSVNAKSLANEVRNQGFFILHTYEHAITGFAIRVPNERMLDAILKNPNVDYVQPDRVLEELSVRRYQPASIERMVILAQQNQVTEVVP